MSEDRTDFRPPLESAEEQFIDLWNNMATLWGISPTMAKIHGLLFVTGDALSMDDIMGRLETSRGNVSMNLTKLLEWGLVRKVHKKGERKDYYESLRDVWEVFTIVARERKRREIDPVLSTLRRLRGELAAGNPDRAARERLARLDGLLQFLTAMEVAAQRFFESREGLRAAVELLAGRVPDDPGAE